MNGKFRGRGAKDNPKYEHLTPMNRLRENRYRKELYLVKEEEIITLEIADFEVHAKTTLGTLTLTEDGKLYEDGVCFDDIGDSN